MSAPRHSLALASPLGSAPAPLMGAATRDEWAAVRRCACARWCLCACVEHLKATVGSSARRKESHCSTAWRGTRSDERKTEWGKEKAREAGREGGREGRKEGGRQGGRDIEARRMGVQGKSTHITQQSRQWQQQQQQRWQQQRQLSCLPMRVHAGSHSAAVIASPILLSRSTTRLCGPLWRTMRSSSKQRQPRGSRASSTCKRPRMR